MHQSSGRYNYGSRDIRIMRMLVLAILVAAAFCWTGLAHGAPVITWYTYQLPPLYIQEGPDKGQGIIDLALQRHLIPGMPGYQHKIVNVPLKRLELMLKEDPTACALGLLKKPEREKTMLFSSPFFAQIPPGAMLPAALVSQLKPYLRAGDKLSLRDLLADENLVVGVHNGRSYGAGIDEMLLSYADKKNVYINSTTNPAKSLFQMNALGRVNLMLGFPYEASFLNEKDTADFIDLKFFPLLEQPAYLPGHAVCAKGAFGEQAIRQINTVFARREILEAVASYYEARLNEDARPLARQVFAQAFPQKARARK
ncbi:TIGR02285 family protein [Undibacterium sp. TJN19]|uniref:TIGR02285 family protein n=1 Tax=Undibacterium sp. TJN19 TaxID=3413055 RepID=UPI003BF15AE1